MYERPMLKFKSFPAVNVLKFKSFAAVNVNVYLTIMGAT